MAVEERARPSPRIAAPVQVAPAHRAAGAQHGAGDDQLGRAQAENGAPHRPNARRPQLEPDDEEQHQDAELADLADALHIGDETEA